MQSGRQIAWEACSRSSTETLLYTQQYVLLGGDMAVLQCALMQQITRIALPLCQFSTSDNHYLCADFVLLMWQHFFWIICETFVAKQYF